MRFSTFALGLLLLSGAAVAQPVDVGSGDWSAFPELEKRGELRMTDGSMDIIERIAGTGQCTVPGLSGSSVDINVPFIVRYDREGAIEQIVLRELGCPELEVVLGAAVLEMTRAGEYRRAASSDGWHRGEISFANQ